MPKPKLGTTYGHVKQSAAVNRVYFKPTYKKWIARFPGVTRRSTKVLKINEVLYNLKDSPNHPARKCKGKEGPRPWPEFAACMSKELSELLKGR